MYELHVCNQLSRVKRGFRKILAGQGTNRSAHGLCGYRDFLESCNFWYRNRKVSYYLMMLCAFVVRKGHKIHFHEVIFSGQSSCYKLKVYVNRCYLSGRTFVCLFVCLSVCVCVCITRRTVTIKSVYDIYSTCL